MRIRIDGRWLILLLLWSARSGVPAEPGNLQGENLQFIQEDFTSRQHNSLQEIAHRISSSTPEKGAAQLFLQESLDQANADLLECKGDQCDLVFGTILVRILQGYSTQSQLLFPATRNHLEKQVGQFITAQGNEFLNTHKNSPESESRELMRASLLLLWANYVQSASVEFRWPDERTHLQHQDQYTKELNHALDLRSKYGSPERGSPYYLYTIAALLNLRDYSADAILRKKAEAVVDWLLVDIALESIGGLWGGARCRGLEAVVPLPGHRLQYILFGQELVSAQDPETHPLTLIFAQTGYRPPPFIVRLGAERKTRGSYEVKTRYCEDLNDPEKAGTGLKYAYVTPDYILGSFPLRDGRVPWQTRPWDLLVWDGESIRNHLFTFTGNQLFSGSYPPYIDSYYLWNSTCYQYKNVLFCRFQRSDRKRPGSRGAEEPVDARFEQLPTRVWISNDFAPVMEENGWWFSRLGEIYLAFRPLRGRSHWWRTVELGKQISNAAAILAFQDLDTPFLLEVEQKSNYSSFEQFKKQVLAAPLTVDKQSVTFVSRRGDVFLFPLDQGDFLVNGRVVDPWKDPAYDLFSSPYTNQKYGSGLFTGKWNPFSLTLDFRNSSSPQRIVEPAVETSSEKQEPNAKPAGDGR